MRHRCARCDGPIPPTKEADKDFCPACWRFLCEQEAKRQMNSFTPEELRALPDPFADD